MNEFRTLSTSFSEELKGFIKLKRKRRWVRRYVVLTGGKLSYFKTPTTIKPRAAINLSGARINNLGQLKGELLFELVKPNFFSIQFAFTNQDEYNQWHHHIMKYAEEFKSNGDINTDCRYMEDLKRREQNSNLLLGKLNVVYMPHLMEQRIREIIGKDYTLAGVKGESIYSVNQLSNKTEADRSKTISLTLIGIMMIWIILHVLYNRTATVTVLFLIFG